MRPKKVYDLIGSMEIKQNKVEINTVILLPLDYSKGKPKKVKVLKKELIKIPVNDYNTFLLPIECVDITSNLREYDVEDYYVLKLDIERNLFDFTNGDKMRLVVIHANGWKDDEPNEELIQCLSEYANTYKYDDNSDFNCDKNCEFIQPETTGESILVGT